MQTSLVGGSTTLYAPIARYIFPIPMIHNFPCSAYTRITLCYFIRMFHGEHPFLITSPFVHASNTFPGWNIKLCVPSIRAVIRSFCRTNHRYFKDYYSVDLLLHFHHLTKCSSYKTKVIMFRNSIPIIG